MVSQLVSLSDSVGVDTWSILALIGWEFLLRMQSECIPIEVGEPGELAVLPERRHSSVFVDSRGAITLRLRSRKHRPRGSVLRRPCRCRTVGTQFCCACRFRAWAGRSSPTLGQRVSHLSAYFFLKEMKRLLFLLGHAHASEFSLKAFRAGRATDIAKRGGSWQQVLAAGEWRGMSAASYLDSNVIDEAAYLKAVLEASSESEVDNP